MIKFHQILRLFKETGNNSFYFFIVMFLTSSFLESLGLSLVIPVVALILDPNFLTLLQNSSFAIFIPDFIFKFNNFEAIIFFSVAIIVTYIVKNIFLLIVTYLINSFIGKLNSKLQKKMIEIYLHQDLTFHSKKSFSEINANITQKIKDVTNGVLMAFLQMLSEILIIISIIILIFFIGFEDILYLILTFLIFSFLLVKFSKNFIKKISIKRETEINEKFKSLHNIINNLREFILQGNFQKQFKNFYESLFTENKLTASHQTLSKVPQILFETLGILGLMLIIFYLKFQDASTVKIISTCSFFAAVSYKILPSLNRIISLYIQFKFYSPSLTSLEKDLKLELNIEYHKDKFNFQNSLKLKDISFGYSKNKDKDILDKINLDIKKNEIIGIIGSSGSGKSTLLDLISCMIKPISGNIFLDDEIIDDNYKARKLQNIISYASQKTSVMNGSLKENICMVAEKEIDQERYLNAIKLSELEDFITQYGDNLNINDYGKNISGGQLQRIGVAKALYLNKEIIIFDEVTSSLDSLVEKKIIDNICNKVKDKTIIIVTHRSYNLKYCDNIYELRNNDLKKIILNQNFEN